MYTLNTSINKGTPRWSQRSYSALFDYSANGLIFMMEEGALTKAEEVKDDWRAALMAKIIEWIQDNDSHLVPIFAQWDYENYDPTLPSLAYMLSADKEELPNIYLFHSYTGHAVRYPEKLDDAKNFSPELLMAWSTVADAEITVQIYQDQLAWVPPQPEEGEEPLPELTQEQKDDI